MTWLRKKKPIIEPPEHTLEPEPTPDEPVPKKPEPIPSESPLFSQGYHAVVPSAVHLDHIEKWTAAEHAVPDSRLVPIERDYPPTDEDEHDIAHEKDELIKLAKRIWKDDNPNKTLKEQRRLLAQGLIDHLPWEDYLPNKNVATVDFGPTWPKQPAKGQMWLRSDVLPTRLYKYNGQKWIEVNKELTDSYVFNDAYIEYLMDMIVRGEYDQDLLTQAERNQIESRLK